MALKLFGSFVALLAALQVANGMIFSAYKHDESLT